MQQSSGSSGSDQNNNTTATNNNNATSQPPATAGGPPGAAAAWMAAMQYPAAAMVMQHQMLPQHYAPPPPHYMSAYHPHHPYMQAPPPPPPHPHHHHQQHRNNNNNNHHHSNNNNNNNSHNNNGNNNNSNNNDGSSGENKTIWVGDLHHWMDELYLSNCFSRAGEIASVKVIRNKQTGASEGYGFVEFFTRANAEKVLQTHASMLMPNTEQPFRLNWATFSMGDKRTDNGSDLSIFVGDLAADVTDTMLHELFANKYPSVKAAKVVIDANTSRSKGYGFVRFGDDSERTQAMTEMNGVYCSTRPMRIGPATPRKSLGYQQGGYASNGNGQGAQSDGDSSNTTIFVGGLDPSVTDEELRQPFSQYGEIVSVKIPVGKGCGFVQFANRGNAEEALSKLNGTVIGKQTVRLSWGRNPANKQSRGDYANQWNGGYYGGHMYDGYGYALPHPHDPSMYAAAAYGTYPVYGNQQQVS